MITPYLELIPIIEDTTECNLEKDNGLELP